MFGRNTKGKNVTMKVEKGLMNTIVLETQTYWCETWTWSEAENFRIQAAEMSY